MHGINHDIPDIPETIGIEPSVLVQRLAAAILSSDSSGRDLVDTEKYHGICYEADNWIRVGETTGLGKQSKSRRPLLCKKDIYIHPLTRHFRQELCA